MGFSTSFIALKGVSRRQVLDVLGVAETDVVATPYEAPFCWGESPTGWLILASNDPDFAAPPRLALLSNGGEAVGCWVMDHVMASEAWGYRDGAEIWSLHYDCEEGAAVQISGDPPTVFASIYEVARLAQAAEDERVDHIFDVPADVVAAICGYRYDMPEPSPFTELRLPEPPRGGAFAWLKDMFASG